LPVWIIFEPLQNFITNYVAINTQLITWIFAMHSVSMFIAVIIFLPTLHRKQPSLITKEESA